MKAADDAFHEFELNRVLTVNSKAKIPPRLDAAQEDITAVLLVGGIGTRLQSVLPATPKPLAPVGGAPFLQLLVRQLRSQGIRRVVMCTGHLADQIEEEFGDGHKWDLAIMYSKESRPLGTAGAVKFAECYLAPASDFLVMNGDSFLELDFSEFMRFHREHNGLISIAVRRVPDTTRYGTDTCSSAPYSSIFQTDGLASKRICFHAYSDVECMRSSSRECSLISGPPKITRVLKNCAGVSIWQLCPNHDSGFTLVEEVLHLDQSRVFRSRRRHQ